MIDMQIDEKNSQQVMEVLLAMQSIMCLEKGQEMTITSWVLGESNKRRFKRVN